MHVNLSPWLPVTCTETESYALCSCWVRISSSWGTESREASSCFWSPTVPSMTTDLTTQRLLSMLGDWRNITPATRLGAANLMVNPPVAPPKAKYERSTGTCERRVETSALTGESPRSVTWAGDRTLVPGSSEAMLFLIILSLRSPETSSSKARPSRTIQSCTELLETDLSLLRRFTMVSPARAAAGAKPAS
eukprot:29461_1